MISDTSLSTKIGWRPVSPQLGAVIEDFDVRKPLSLDEVEQLKDLLMRYKVLFFPEQNLDYDEHERFAAHFGAPRFDPLENTIDGHPGLALVDNVPWFHSDWMHQEFPTHWSMLQMNVVPEVGGDTMFADLVASYETLSEPLRHFLEGLTVFQRVLRYKGNTDELLADRIEPHSHPLVRYIPETGRKNYWVSRAFTEKINELDSEESDLLLGYLFQHQIEPQYVIRWTWHPGDIAFWDHRTTLHSGIKDYGDLERHACRASIVGGRIIPAWEAPA